MTAHYPDLIAIDGPSASSKTSAGQWLAQRLGYALFDTGPLFRTLSWLLLRDKAPEADQETWLQNVLADEALLSKTLRFMDQHMRIESVEGRPPATAVYIEGKDITRCLHQENVSRILSQVSAVKSVRAKLTAVMRRIGTRWRRERGCIVVGRDIGTVVFPEAQCKFFLTASVEERARRRHKQLEAQGDASVLEDVLANMKERDRIDTTRADAPLKAAADAIVLDSTAWSPEETEAQVLAALDRRFADKPYSETG